MSSLECDQGIVGFNNTCICFPGWLSSTNCTTGLADQSPPGWIFVQICLLLCWTILAGVSLTAVGRIFKTGLEDPYHTNHIKRLHIALLSIFSVLSFVAHLDPFGQWKMWSAQTYLAMVGCQLCLMPYLAVIQFWHWAQLYRAAQSASQRRAKSNWGLSMPRGGAKSAEQTKINTKGKLIAGVTICNAIMLLWILLCIGNSLMSSAYNDPINYVYALLVLIFYLGWTFFFIHFGRRFQKYVAFKSIAKWKLQKTFDRIVIRSIVFSISYLAAGLIYFLLLSNSELYLYASMILLQAGLQLVVGGELHIYFKWSTRAPFISWKQGRSFSPRVL